MVTDRRAALGELARFVTLIFASVGVLAIAGYLPTRRLVGSQGVVAMGLALGIGALASLAGAVPVYAARRAAEPRPHLVLASMLVRLLAVVALALPAIWWSGVPNGPLLVWLVISYLALLVVDTLYAMRALGSL